MSARTAFGPAPVESARARRGSPLLAAAVGRQGTLSRPAVARRRSFPGPASATTPALFPLPVLTPAHRTSRAIRVRRSPR